MIELSDITLRISQLLPEPHAGLLSGILFGTKASLDAELKNALIQTGTLHIVALSGMNITILISLTATTLSRVISRRKTGVLTIIIIMGFVLFVGVSASVVRAALMGSLSLIATLLGKQRSALFLLLVSSGVMLGYNPMWLGEISFQLSFLATLGLILYGKRAVSPPPGDGSISTPGVELLHTRSGGSWVYFFRLFWGFVMDEMRTSLAAQVFTIPILFFQFHRVSLISPVANVAIGWVIPFVTIFGIILSVISVFSLSLATPLSWVIWVLLEYVLWVVGFMSAIPFASIEW